jgi:hypothetical protein
MPTISVFFGIIIQMYCNEHMPPHFHCTYGDQEAVVAIESLEVITGKMSRRALNLVFDWAELHQSELLEDWNLCQAKQQPKPIAPLE